METPQRSESADILSGLDETLDHNTVLLGLGGIECGPKGHEQERGEALWQASRTSLQKFAGSKTYHVCMGLDPID